MGRLVHATMRFWSGRRLATQILFAFLPLLVVPLGFTGVLAVGAMVGFGEVAEHSVTHLGRDATAESQTALTDLARDALLQAAIDNAALGDAELERVVMVIETLARYAGLAWSSTTASSGAPVVESPIRTAGYRLAPGVDPGIVADEIARAIQVQPLFRALAGAESSATAVYLATESGIMVMAPSADALPPDFDPRARPWYHAALRSNGVAWTDPYVDLAGQGLVMTVARRVVDGSGRVVGVVGVDVASASMTRRLAETGLSGEGYAFALDERGHVVIAPELDEGDTEADRVFVTGDLLASHQPDVRELAARMVQGQSGVLQVQLDGGVRYVAYAPLRTNGWSVAVVVDVADIVAPAARIDSHIAGQVAATRNAMDGRLAAVRAQFGIVLVLILLVAVGVTVAVSQTITGRLRTLEGAALALERGDLADRDVEELGATEGKDEVGGLMRVFARMAQRVRAREQELRMEVQQLHIEIDQAKAAQQVAEITETEFFQDLQAKARALRTQKSPGES